MDSSSADGAGGAFCPVVRQLHHVTLPPVWRGWTLPTPYRLPFWPEPSPGCRGRPRASASLFNQESILYYYFFLLLISVAVFRLIISVIWCIMHRTSLYSTNCWTLIKSSLHWAPGTLRTETLHLTRLHPFNPWLPKQVKPLKLSLDKCIVSYSHWKKDNKMEDKRKNKQKTTTVKCFYSAESFQTSFLYIMLT